MNFNYVHYKDELDIICYYLLFIAIPVGIIGNLVSIFIFTRRSLNQRTNTGFFYTILCIVNVIQIVFISIFKRWDSFSNFRIYLNFNIENYIETIILQTVCWIQALISFDRFIVVYSPIKGVRIMSKKWVLCSIILGLFILIICFDLPSFIHTYKTTDIAYHLSYLSSVLNWVTEFIMSLMGVQIPFLIMVILDILVVFRLKRSRMQTHGSNSRQTGQSSRSYRFTINTILIDLIYFIFNFPFTICNIIFLINMLNKSSHSILNFVSGIVSQLPFFYSCLLFFTFLIFNRNFRSEFFSIGFMSKLKNILKINTDSSRVISKR